MNSRIGYVSFDIVPAPKGAGTHIEAFARALGRAFGVELITVAEASEIVGPIERWPGVHHTELPAVGVTLIDRVLHFRACLRACLKQRQWEAVQFRSIFEGLPLLTMRTAQIIFEVNGLPSIELKYRYPRAADDRELMRKVLAQEQACLEAADRIVTPSAVTRSFLQSKRGVDARKIRVIPNGVDLDVFTYARGLAGHELKMLYFGTLSPWQGVDLAVRALSQIHPHSPATLTVIGAGSKSQVDGLLRMGGKLGVASQLRVLGPMSQAELVQQLHEADVVLAPLTLNDRNCEQGCCPLKILESMAAGAPVIASDLPVVRELGSASRHLVLVKPGSVDAIVSAVLNLQDTSREARAHVEENFTWTKAGESLVRVYEELGIRRSSTV